MKKRIREEMATRCSCAEIAPDTVLPRDWQFVSHLWFVSDCGDTSPNIRYWLCPLTGVVWEEIRIPDWRMDEFEYRRTSYIQSAMHERTIAVGVLQLYTKVKRKWLYIYPFSIETLPQPLSGCLITAVNSYSGEPLEWQVPGLFRCRGNLDIWVWLYLENPLGFGEAGQVWVASFLEAVTQQVFTEGSTYIVAGAGGIIGELTILCQQRVEQREFSSRFVFDEGLVIL